MESIHDFELIDIKQETADIKSFVFKPLGDFSWLAGQYLDWQLPHANPDDRGQRRWFSISSAPSEEVVMLSCRFSDEGSTLKKHLFSLEVGAKVQAKGPLGEFTADSNNMPLVLVAGGIGITPFRSILIERAHTGTLSNVTLIYGNKTQDNIPFKNELDQLAQNNSGFRLEYVVGKHINAEVIGEVVGELDNNTYMISGLEKMVAAIEESLEASGVSKGQIHIDDFGGYDWNIDKAIYQ